MKRIPFVLAFIVYAPVLIAGYSDGFITAGEYEYGVDWTSYSPPLIVNGGGADLIEVRSRGRLEVISTSTPLGLDRGGIYDIGMLGNSSLLYLGGSTRVLAVASNATAELKGGTIKYLRSLQYTTTTGAGPHIDLYCLPGHAWISGNALLGVEGQWWDGSPFRIEFINDDPDVDPTWTNINFIIPEPATITLFAISGICLLRKRRTGIN